MTAEAEARGTAQTLAGEMSNFASNFVRLQSAVQDACGRGAEWPEKIAAAIYAAIEFAAADPETTRALMMEARLSRTDGGRSYLEMIEYFSELLRRGAPHDQPLASSTEEALIGGIAAVVSDHLRAGRVDRLCEIAPELVYLTLLPYLGFAEAKRWAWPTPAV